MPCDDSEQVEIQVIQDVLDTVEERLRLRERTGWRLTVPRSRVYAAVLYAVVVSARESHRLPATLDRAEVLDSIFDGTDGRVGRPVEEVIDRYVVNAN